MNQRPPQPRCAGFTLIEIVLVVVILGVAGAVAIPTFARSFRGAKLRSSVRTVLMVHRNAQSKAVLGQRYAAVLFDDRKQTLELVEQGASGTKQDAFFGTVGGGSAPPGGAMGAVVSGAEPTLPQPPPPNPVLLRKLEDGVQILSFRGGREIDGIHFINYYPNGMCDAYEIVIGDDENRSQRIAVDAVTGRAKVTRD